MYTGYDSYNYPSLVITTNQFMMSVAVIGCKGLLGLKDYVNHMLSGDASQWPTGITGMAKWVSRAPYLT